MTDLNCTLNGLNVEAGRLHSTVSSDRGLSLNSLVCVKPY